MLFNLNFANNTILPCFFLLIIALYFLIYTVIAQIFNAIAELLVSIGTPIKKKKAEIEIQPLIVESKTRKCSV